MEFTDSTLNNIKQAAKELSKQNEEINLTQARDFVVKDRGFKSYKDFIVQYKKWKQLAPVYILLRQNYLAEHTYQINEDSNEIQEKIIDPEVLNHVKNCGLKLLKDEENELMQEKHKSKIFNSIPAYFYKLTSFRVPTDDYGTYRMPEDIAYKIHGYLNERVKLHKDPYYEDITFSDAIYLVGDSFYYENDLFDENYSDHVMTHDFYN